MMNLSVLHIIQENYNVWEILIDNKNLHVIRKNDKSGMSPSLFFSVLFSWVTNEEK